MENTMNLRSGHDCLDDIMEICDYREFLNH